MTHVRPKRGVITNLKMVIGRSLYDSTAVVPFTKSCTDSSVGLTRHKVSRPQALELRALSKAQDNIHRVFSRSEACCLENNFSVKIVPKHSMRPNKVFKRSR